MTEVLFSWLGTADIQGSAEQPATGPLVQILEARHYDLVYLLHNQRGKVPEECIRRLRGIFAGQIVASEVSLNSPIHFADIYRALDGVMAEASRAHPGANLSIQLTSGTPAMAAVSILIGKAKYPAAFIQSSREQGVTEEDLPFDIAADFLPALAQQRDERLKVAMAGFAPDTAAFDDIVTQDEHMNILKARAAVLAQRDVPVLIYGESGTGKELFARAIRNTSLRADKPFLVLNCGAIPPELVESTLFGHVKGAFTGATGVHKGYFEQANGGTLFLDEFGELSKPAQVRLLRVLQEGTFTPVGATAEQKVDVRIIAATNRNLVDEVAAGNFREDLFYRVAIGVLHLPPLRERVVDLTLLAETLTKNINRAAVGQSAYKDKKLSVGAINVIRRYPWPGNVRELYATLLRASLWQRDEVITEEDIREAILAAPAPPNQILDKPLSSGVDIKAIVEEVCTHYIRRAMNETQGNKTQAAKLIGLKNYQTLNNWMDKYGIA